MSALQFLVLVALIASSGASEDGLVVKIGWQALHLLVL